MAVFKIFPEKDATIYSEFPYTNTGKDEMLEIAAYYKGTEEYVARTLIQFDNAELTNVINTYVSSSTRQATEFSASLRLYLATADELPTSYKVEAYPIYVHSYDEWNQGTGKFYDVPNPSDGASWVFTQQTGSGTWLTSTRVAQSYSGSTPGGGAWYTGSDNYTFDTYQLHTVASTHDLNLDVTEEIKAFYEEEIINNGLILKLSGSLEFLSENQVFLRYFSTDTHTIYPPCLELKWDDYVSTGSLSEISTSNNVVKIKNNRGRYTDEGFQKFKLHVRPKFPTRTFATSSAYIDNYYLPTASYWGLRDENTEEMVVDFDTTYTKLSRGTDGNYFNVHMAGLQPERYYRVLLKTTIDGSTNVLDEDILFKVVRNG